MNRFTARGAMAALTGALTATLLAAPALATTPAGGTADPEDAGSTGKLVLLMDSSGSMNDPDSAGDPKIDAARSALNSVIDSLGDDQHVGLRVFGANELGTSNPAACTDSDLVVPIGTGNQDALRTAVTDYTPYGETPIAYALQEAGADLGSEGQRSILLVSDGISTCDPDPCGVAADLSEDGIDLAIHAVGFDVDERAREQLRCIADAGGGQYFDATDTESLTSALEQVSTRAFRPFSIAGEPVVGTPQPADAPVLGAGQFTDTLADREMEAKHYRIERTSPRSVIHAGVTMRPDRGGLSAYQLRLETVDGRYCGGAVGTPWSAGSSSSFGTAATASGDSDKCQEADELILTVWAQNGSEQILGTPFELVVREVPWPSNETDLPGPAPEPEWQGLEPGTPAGEIVAGSSLNSAAPIEPGQTFSSELTRGEIVFFRVPVDYGQRLEALVEFPQRTGALADSTGAIADSAELSIIGPTRGEVDEVNADLGDLRQRASLSRTGAHRMAATTSEVRFANHDHITIKGGASIAGDYYLAVSLTSQDELLLPVPFTITTQVVGEVSGVPEFDTAAAGDADPTTEATDDAQETATTADEPDQTDDAADDTTDAGDGQEDAAITVPDDDGAPAGLLLGLGTLGVALLGAGGFVLARVLRT